MIGEPLTPVECDQCGEIDYFDMTALTCNSYDNRGLKSAMRRAGWVTEDDRTFCDADCRDNWHRDFDPPT